MTNPVETVDTWLATQGYPHEYSVARTLAFAGFRTWQGIHYRDKESDEQKTREIDVIASVWPEGAEKIPTVTELVVEVKYSGEPWLALTTELALRPPDLHPYLLVTDKASAAVEGILDSPPVPIALTLPERHAFNIVQTGSEKATRPNPAYAAMTSVVKAAAARRAEFGRGGTGIFFPVIVVAGPLLQLGYDLSGERILQPIVWQRVRWQGSSVLDHPVLVDVVQIDHLPIWAKNAHSDLSAIDEVLTRWVTVGGLAAPK